MLAHLFGLLGLLSRLIFPLRGLVCLVFSFLLFGAAVFWALNRPPGRSLRWLKVYPSIGGPIRIFTGGVTGGEWRRGVVRWVNIFELFLQKHDSVKATYLELLSLCHRASPSEEASLGSACSVACQHRQKTPLSLRMQCLLHEPLWFDGIFSNSFWVILLVYYFQHLIWPDIKSKYPDYCQTFSRVCFWNSSHMHKCIMSGCEV